ncbi:MAG: hypothetical protein ACRCXL_00235 [Dermatophilaceae bacterium]
MTLPVLTPVRLATDEDLVGRVRADADAAAASELWVRYHSFGVNAAHVVRGRSEDAEFVAAEAFSALLGSLGRGATVDDPFSLLLARRVSRAAVEPADAAARSDILDDPAAFDDPDATRREPQADALEQSVLREAFAALPDDSRVAIWHEVAGRCGLGTPAAATRSVVARFHDDLRVRYVATLMARDAVVPACRSYVAELPALVAGRETPPDVIAHAAGCHRCTNRVDRMRELEHAVPAAVLPLLAPLTSGSALPLLGALPAVDGTQLDIVPHQPTVRALPPQQAARWVVGAGLAASVLVAAAAIWSTTPTEESPVIARGGSIATDPGRGTAPLETPRDAGDSGTRVDPPNVRPEVPPTDPPVTGQPSTGSEPGEATEPGTDPGTGGAATLGSDSPPEPTEPTGPVATADPPSPSSAPVTPSAPTDSPVQVDVAVMADDGAGTADIQVFAVGAREIELTIAPPAQVKVDIDTITSSLDCAEGGGEVVVCTGAPGSDGSIAAGMQLDWPEEVAGEVTVDVRVLDGENVGSTGQGADAPDPASSTDDDSDQPATSETAS